jgi:hypothetical protein
VVQTIGIGFPSQSHGDFLIAVEFDRSFEKRVELELLVFSLQMDDLIGDILEDVRRHFYLILADFVILALIHDEIKHRHGAVLHFLLLPHRNRLGCQQGLEHLGAYVDL